MSYTKPTPSMYATPCPYIHHHHHHHHRLSRGFHFCLNVFLGSTVSTLSNQYKTITIPRQQENDGLTVPLTAFYAASLVLALSHIHKQGIVFRDLKPENIMLDNTGYLRGEVEVEIGIDAKH